MENWIAIIIALLTGGVGARIVGAFLDRRKRGAELNMNLAAAAERHATTMTKQLGEAWQDQFELHEKYNNLVLRMTAIETENTRHKSRINHLEVQNRRHLARIKELEAEKATVVQKYHQLLAEHHQIKKQLKTTQEELAASKAREDELSQRIDELENKVNNK